MIANYFIIKNIFITNFILLYFSTPVILLAVHCILPIVVTSTAATFVNGLAKTKDKTLPEVMKVAQNGRNKIFDDQCIVFVLSILLVIQNKVG